MFWVTETQFKINDTAIFTKGQDEFQAICEWVEFHGIDPRLVPLCSILTRNVAECCVEYDEIEVEKWTDSGYPVPKIGDHKVPVIKRVRSQGEAPPLPFPEILFRSELRESRSRAVHDGSPED